MNLGLEMSWAYILPIPGTTRGTYTRFEDSYHTLARKYERVLKATKQVNGKAPNLTSRHTKTP